MGRVFWKFAAFIFAAQLAGILAAGVLFWIESASHDHRPGYPGGPRELHARMPVAEALLHYAGMAAFIDWAQAHPGATPLAVTQQGQELLGRPVAPEPAGADAPIAPSGTQAHRVLVTTPEGEKLTLIDVPVAWEAGRGPHAQSQPPPGVRHLHLPPAGATIMTLLASVITAALLAWYVVRPVRSLRRAFDAAGRGELNVRVGSVVDNRKDELADLARDFDRMAERLQQSMHNQRNLLHDVSHEIRSPLARLQAALAILEEQRGLAEDPVVQRIAKEITRIDDLIGEILTLSRLDSGERDMRVEDIEVRELLEGVVANARFEAGTRGMQIDCQIRQDGTLRGDGRLLHSALENVVRNALAHAGAGPVHVRGDCDASGKHFVIEVRDHGPGIPHAELAAIFTPFRRGNSARETPGYGLGLAIARRVIEAHGGTIEAQNLPEGGLCVRMRLPRLAASASTKT